MRYTPNCKMLIVSISCTGIINASSFIYQSNTTQCLKLLLFCFNALFLQTF